MLVDNIFTYFNTVLKLSEKSINLIKTLYIMLVDNIFNSLMWF